MVGTKFVETKFVETNTVAKLFSIVWENSDRSGNQSECSSARTSSVIYYNMVLSGMVMYGMVWYGMVWYGMVRYGMVWCMVWCGMVRYGMVWRSFLGVVFQIKILGNFYAYIFFSLVYNEFRHLELSSGHVQ